MEVKPYPLKIFKNASETDPILFQKIIKILGIESGKTVFKEFQNGEFISRHDESIRDSDVYLFAQPKFGNKNRLSFDLDETETMVFSLKQGEPKGITVIIPCLPYARQDRATNYREPVLVQKIPMRLQMAGAKRIVTLRLHNESSYNAHPNTIPIVNIKIDNLLIRHILMKEFDLSKFQIVSPDHGAVNSCRKLAQDLGIPSNIVIVNKYRDPNTSNKSEVMEIIGNPKGYNCIIPDDIADTCGTALKTARALRARGAEKIFFTAVHPILSGQAVENLQKANFEGIWFFDTCASIQLSNISNLEIIPTDKLIADIILNLHNGGSITELSRR